MNNTGRLRSFYMGELIPPHALPYDLASSLVWSIIQWVAVMKLGAALQRQLATVLGFHPYRISSKLQNTEAKHRKESLPARCFCATSCEGPGCCTLSYAADHVPLKAHYTITFYP